MTTPTITSDLPIVNIMIDLETLGLTPGCVILEIGACVVKRKNDPYSPTDFFHCSIAKDYQVALGFTVDPDTAAWWEKQDSAAKLEAFSGMFAIETALHMFSAWIAHFPNKRVWGNSASFDLKILEAAYKKLGFPVPWSYKEEMCYRTVRNLYPAVAWPSNPVIAHRAIDDAIAQAHHLAEILKLIPTGQN